MRIVKAAPLAVILSFLSQSTQAALIDAGGGMIYDSDQDITWLQDANYALTSGFDADGLMNWDDAVAWAAGLSFGGFDDWRLPTTTQPDASCSTQTDPGSGFPLQGSGGGCTGSEMGHILNVDGVSGGSPDPFLNLAATVSAYRSGTEYAPNVNAVWIFDANSGAQVTGNKLDVFHAWAVHDGNPGGAVIPIPAAVWLFGSALGLLGWMKRKYT